MPPGIAGLAWGTVHRPSTGKAGAAFRSPQAGSRFPASSLGHPHADQVGAPRIRRLHRRPRPSGSPGPPPPDLVRALCHKDGCDEFRVIETRVVRPAPDGVLRSTRVQAYSSNAAGRVARDAEAGYVFCSRTRPAVIAQKEGRSVAFMVAPFAREDTPETVRRNANFVALYFAACHGPEAGREAVRDLSGVARSLGYQVEAQASKVVALTRAEDIVGAEPAPDPRQEPDYGRREEARGDMGRPRRYDFEDGPRYETAPPRRGRPDWYFDDNEEGPVPPGFIPRR